DHEAVGCLEVGKVDDGGGIGAGSAAGGAGRGGLAEEDVGLAGEAAARAAIGRADDQVVEVIPVDVAGRRDAPAGKVARRTALDDEAVGRGEIGEIDDRPARSVQFAKSRRLAVQDIGGSRRCAVASGGGIADDQVVVVVAVQVAGRSHAPADQIAGGAAL